MSVIIKQSTARTVLVGPVLDSNGAAKTDEVVANIKITKNGTVGAADGSTTLTHDHAGKYKLAMAAGDTDTLGVLEISLNSGTNDMPVARFNVVPTMVFDSLVAGSDRFDANVTHVADTAQTGRDIGASVLLSPGTGTGQISLSSGAVTAGTVSDKTGYSLAADQAVNVTKWGGTAVASAYVQANTAQWGGAALPTAFAVSDKTGFSLANGSIETATFGTCVTPETANTNKLAFTGSSPYYVQSDVVDWKGATAPAMTGDAYAYLGTNLGALGANATALAPASTALSSSTWTNTKAGYIDVAISSRGTGDATAANQTTIIGYVDDIGVAGAGLTAIPKTGYKLASDGLDSIAVTRPTTVATTFPQMLVQMFYRFFGKATKTSTQLKTYAADGTTVVTTQTVSDDGTTETQGSAT